LRDQSKDELIRSLQSKFWGYRLSIY
jgi:hypothetical protein